MVKFGTGGWRAVIAEEFTFSNVRKVALAVTLHLQEIGQQHKPVVIGYDLRFLSEHFARAFAEILAQKGIGVLFMKEAVPTPVVMFAVAEKGLALGIMITASHNPYEYNGIKVVVAGGKSAPQEVTGKLEQHCALLPELEAPATGFELAVQQGRIEYYSNKNSYLNALLAQIDVQAVQQLDFRVLFNPMHGVAKDLMQISLASLRCYVDLVNGERDAFFGFVNPCPFPESLRDMEQLMRGDAYDLGIATDGDSDRVAFFDEKGNFVSGNEVIKLFYYYLKEYRGEAGGVVRNLTTTHIVDRIARSYGETAYEVPIGFKYIFPLMEEENLLLGGEGNGGLKLRGHVNDGILGALLALEILAKTKKPLSEFVAEIDQKYGTLYFEQLGLPYHPQNRDRLEQLLFQERYLPKFPLPIEKVSYADGVKFYFPNDNWLSIRFSGTEPLLRVILEADDAEQAKRLQAAVLNDLRLQLPTDQRVS